MEKELRISSEDLAPDCRAKDALELLEKQIHGRFLNSSLICRLKMAMFKDGYVNCNNQGKLELCAIPRESLPDKLIHVRNQSRKAKHTKPNQEPNKHVLGDPGLRAPTYLKVSGAKQVIVSGDDQLVVNTAFLAKERALYLDPEGLTKPEEYGYTVMIMGGIPTRAVERIEPAEDFIYKYDARAADVHPIIPPFKIKQVTS